jgi:peroxiredoxin
MIRYAIALVAAAFLAASSVSAGEFNKKLSIGDAAPTFRDLQGVDNKSYALDSFKDKEVLVVVITCNHCPVATSYEDRIIALTKKYSGKDSKVGIIAINVNKLDADKIDKMKVRAKEKGFNFPYAYDPSQGIGKKLGATLTPEFFVFDKDRKVVYMGALDDDEDAAKAKVNYVDDAVIATLKGEKPAKAETRARGSSVQYDK